MKQSIYCLAKNSQQAEQIINDLHTANISDDRISVLYADQKKSNHAQSGAETTHREHRQPRRGLTEETHPKKRAHKSTITFEKGSKSAEGAITGATAGGVIGGTIGLLAGLGTIALPGIGALVAAGPLLASLSGVAVGSISGGIAGSISAANIPEYYVAQASAGLHEGRILFAVDFNSNEDAKAISNIFEKDGATDISIASNK